MKKHIIVLVAAVLIGGIVSAQDLTKFNLYKPAENASEVIAKEVKEAKDSKKNVFIQIGGNWCIWCARFNDLVTKDASIDSVINDNYIVYHLNYSKENKNEALLAKYGYPQRFGFPVFLILDGNGKLLHTQNSAYLEKDKGYDREKVIGFFKDWTPSVFDPKQYKDQ
ncbi:MAG: thioredoxin family protein [Chitinophagaceae bacterium]